MEQNTFLNPETVCADNANLNCWDLLADRSSQNLTCGFWNQATSGWRASWLPVLAGPEAEGTAPAADCQAPQVKNATQHGVYAFSQPRTLATLQPFQAGFRAWNGLGQ